MKPSLPQGTRDFGPDVVRKRQYILDTIKREFELYGFQPLETPAMENLETLMGKYGEEGDKLIYRILDSGNPFSKDFFPDLWTAFKEYNDRAKEFLMTQGIYSYGPLDLKFLDINPQVFDSFITEFLSTKESSQKYIGALKQDISSKALKYDLTIPFARYVAMNHGQLIFPFKRYQIQPVWRADRPQRGRYREFYQCDADVVGSNSLWNEVEFVNLYDGVLKKLRIVNYELRINSRKLLTALAELCGGAAHMLPITIAIDKLDKIGLEKVKDELRERGLSETQISVIENYLNISGRNEEKLIAIKKLFANSEIGKKGIEELEAILENTVDGQQTPVNLVLDFTLARGLNYYTGVIFEAKAPAEVKIGSIGGGGRYDDLTGLFGVPNMPGVGISFGVDRIYDVLEELHLFPQTIAQGTNVLIFNVGAAESKTAYRLLKKLRAQGIASELYHEEAKSDKQFKYAEKKNIPYVIREIVGENCVVKNIKTGTQQTLQIKNLLNDALTF